MKKEDKIELSISIVSGILAFIALIFIKSGACNPLHAPLYAGVICCLATCSFFFALSFSQRKVRNGQA